MKKRLYPLAILLLLQSIAFGKHIIGGVLSYECLGNGNYLFTMKMYRDCSDNTGANFDFGAPFSIYKGNSQTPLTTLFLSPDITSIEPEDNPCIEIPPNVCVQEGVYTFEYQFADWPSDQSYHITYQRCCRNATVTNIVNPGDVGATFTVEITPASQDFCNNSPVFNAFPPIVVCVNQPLNFDHSATDAEGDQLIYELCAPLLGGGQGGLGGGNAQGCNGITPNPACPPPYAVAQFSPPYSALNPMGGSPAISIDPITGLLSGTPNLTGQFSVAVCVSEYRNGQLLTVVRRDFQFNVANCEQQIVAEIDAEGLIFENDEYHITNCNQLNVPITNMSVTQGLVDEFRWEFYVGDSTYVFDTWDVNVQFPATGIYEGELHVSAASQCADSAKILIEIYPELVADFTYEYDTCVAGPVYFTDFSHINGPGQIASFEWDFGDSETDSIQHNPVHLYDEPDVIPVQLIITDEHGCSTDTLKNVVYKPVPSLILVSPDDTLSCPPATVFFSNLSSPIDNSYKIRWDFGDGDSSDVISPEHIYQSAGIYDVRLEITSPIGCYTDTVFEKLIQIFPPPVAGFYYDPTDPDNFNPEVHFYDSSQYAVHWDWYVNEKIVSQKTDFIYTFLDTGLHEVKLVITHPEKCLDSLTQVIDVAPEITFHMPNAFSPNEDTMNELFKAAGVTRGITDFRMEIWNRWGELIFVTDKLEEAWNGRVNNTGELAPNGSYPCKVTFTKPRGGRIEYRGFAALIR